MMYGSVYISSGWFEALVKNLGLEFSVVYAGYSGVREIVAKANEEKQGIVYYW
jgi:hypothetical protein